VGTGTLTLSGPNTYTGNTVVSNGILEITQSYLANTADVHIAAPGKLNLNFAGSDTVDKLVINGVQMPAGSYGSTSSGAANQNDTYFAGSGSLDVATGPAGPTPENITHSRSGNNLIMSWTGIGWRLQMQTNSRAIGLNTNWIDVVGATPPYTNSLTTTNPTVFFRLVYP
jgi:autotransporter-associated beta strand protein